MKSRRAVGLLFTLGSVITACSGSESNPGSQTAGASALGGSSSLAGGASSGGALATGGQSTPSNPTTGGSANATGGSNAAGGGPAATGGALANTGGLASTGGANATGGKANGGATNSVGGSATGGKAAGGTPSTGGASATGTGGIKATGGASSTGGSKPTGGAASTGGTASAGGSTGTGGKPYRGVANSPCTARTNLGVSWYYNWMQAANEPCSSPSIGGEFVPMIWGHTGAEQTASSIVTSIATFVTRGNKYVLGFNEPDNTGQANITAAAALTLWPSFNNPSILVGSPATQANTSGTAWQNIFWPAVNANTAGNLRSDFIAFHWYGWNAGSCDAKAATLEAYLKQIEGIAGNRPIWLTEWGCLNNSDSNDPAVTQAHIAGAVAMFAKHPRLERYAWYPWADTAHNLNNTDGSLSALGQYYASLPAYR